MLSTGAVGGLCSQDRVDPTSSNIPNLEGARPARLTAIA